MKLLVAFFVAVFLLPLDAARADPEDCYYTPTRRELSGHGRHQCFYAPKDGCLPEACRARAACVGPACCTVYDTKAICRSPIIDEEARRIVVSSCPLCSGKAVREFIELYQVNRGPYETARELARDVQFGLGLRP